jgi:hypothetical protein
MNYVGIDHHRQYSHMTVMDQKGQVLRSGRVPNLQNEIEKFFQSFKAIEAVIETGRSSYTIRMCLKRWECQSRSHIRMRSRRLLVRKSRLISGTPRSLPICCE